MNGVIWKGVFSASATLPTGLDLSIRSWSFHESTLMRPPSGSAAMALAVGLSFGAGFSPPSGFSSDDCAAKTAEAMLQLVETRSPRCGLIKFGISLALLLSARKNNCALPDLSLYIWRIPQQFDPFLLRSFFLLRCFCRLKVIAWVLTCFSI